MRQWFFDRVVKPALMRQSAADRSNPTGRGAQFRLQPATPEAREASTPWGGHGSVRTELDRWRFATVCHRHRRRRHRVGDGTTAPDDKMDVPAQRASAFSVSFVVCGGDVTENRRALSLGCVCRLLTGPTAAPVHCARLLIRSFLGRSRMRGRTNENYRETARPCGRRPESEAAKIGPSPVRSHHLSADVAAVCTVRQDLYQEPGWIRIL